ncbi:MAG TPA: class I SAM-dependent methyltransferase [Actinomycetes bacterium]|nr:class I SAM-dependent methyltransferase [Actinomycetes bacterium]
MTRLESDYYSYMAFDPAHTREVLAFYVPMFADLGPVLELGCGRGEFLALLEASGVHAEGVDSDEGMVEKARADGLEVTLGDAVELLHAERPPGPYGGVFCAHFVEHLDPDQVARLLAGVRRVLRPGGRFVAVTPNPACYSVLSHDFWRDPTHVRFYDPPLLEFLCRQAGLEVETSGTNPANHPGPPPEFLVPEPAVPPPLDDLIERAMATAQEALAHRQQRLGRAPEPHEPEWAFQLAHVVKVLAGRLREATEALRELRRAHDKLVWGLYQGNETYVVARG